MYLQITSRCNMTCEHCCFSATHTGTDMSRETLIAALKLAESMGEELTVGGGEPTVHPHFFDYLGLAMAYNPEPDTPVWVITNGKRKDVALKLARMAKSGLIGAELSQDDFHDPITKEVIQAFTVEKQKRSSYSYEASSSRDHRGIRTTHSILPVGRALEMNIATESDGCCCDTLLVDPEGRLFACGCKTIQLGTVFEPNLPENYNSEWAHSEEAQEWLAQQDEPILEAA